MILLLDNINILLIYFKTNNLLVFTFSFDPSILLKWEALAFLSRK